MLHCWLHLYMYYECMNYEGELKLYVETPISKHVVVNGTVVDVER